MKTVIDGKEWILQHLNAKRPSISGAIYIDKRITIDKEDIVINDIAMSGRQIQRGFFNVNCYVPNLTVTQGSTKIQVPNKKRLKEIASEVCAKTDKDKDKSTGDFAEMFKALNDKIDKQNDLISGFQAERTAQTNAQKLQAKLKELGVSEDYLGLLPAVDREFQSDEEIETYATDLKSKSDVYEQSMANSSLGNSSKPLFSNSVAEGEVSPHIKARIEAKTQQ